MPAKNLYQKIYFAVTRSKTPYKFKRFSRGREGTHFPITTAVLTQYHSYVKLSVFVVTILVRNSVSNLWNSSCCSSRCVLVYFAYICDHLSTYRIYRTYHVLIPIIFILFFSIAGESSDACAFVPIDDTYNVGLHVGGVFIILVTSSIGIFTAIFLGTHDRFGKHPLVIGAIQLLKFFGVGVVVSTAWIHLLADAYSNFLNPCLVGDAWVNYGANFPGWIAIAASLTVQILEYFAMSREYRLIDRRQNELPHNNSIKVDETGNGLQALNKSANGRGEDNVTLKEVVGHNLLDEDESPQMVSSRLLLCDITFII